MALSELPDAKRTGRRFIFHVVGAVPSCTFRIRFYLIISEIPSVFRSKTRENNTFRDRSILLLLLLYSRPKTETGAYNHDVSFHFRSFSGQAQFSLKRTLVIFKIIYNIPSRRRLDVISMRW